MRRLLFPVALLALAAVGWAQQQAEDPADAAQHGVARISLAEGNVSVTRGDSGEAAGSALNAPLVTTDRIFTGEGGRAEVQFDSANLIRLAPASEVRMGDLQYHRYLVQIAQGTATFRVLRDTGAQIEISTPSISLAPLRQGSYRVTVRPDGSSEITVRAGEADLFSPSGSERLAAGQTILSRGSPSDPEFMTTAAIGNDDWDRWNADRDRYFDRPAEISRYTGPDVSGAEDLAAQGRWLWDPAYGWVWSPNNVAPDWAPYRNGRWDYVDYFGWSWVSYDPWGWAPYHYGNWYRGNFGWAWYPGAIGPRHYWRPAMVGFFGFGTGGFGTPGFGASFGFGYSNVGWVPLAPFEPYRAWYGRGYGGGRNLAIVNNTNIVTTYRNARYSDAVTGLRAADFGRAAVGRNAFVRPGASVLSRAGLVNGGVPFAPARSAAQMNAVRPSAVVPLNGSFQTGGVQNLGSVANRGGWRRLESAPQPGAPQPPRATQPPSGYRTFSQQGSSPQTGQSQPVRISPPIVNHRNQTAPNYGAAPRSDFGGFGGPRPNSAFSAPPASAPPPAPQPRSAPSNGGGGSRGGGGSHAGAGNRGGHGNGHGR